MTLGLSILTYNQPKQIDFAKEGSTSHAYQYLVTNGAVGNLDIMEDIAENLFSVTLITANGYYVLFTRDRVLIINEITLQIVATGDKKSDSNLYYINMLEVIQLPNISESRPLKNYQSPSSSKLAFKTLQKVIQSSCTKNNSYISDGEEEQSKDNEFVFNRDGDEVNNDKLDEAEELHYNQDGEAVNSGTFDEIAEDNDNQDGEADISDDLDGGKVGLRKTSRTRQRDTRLTKQQIQYLNKLHKTTNHTPFRNMAECVRIKDGCRAWDNVPDWITPAILTKFAQKSQCLPCTVAHQQVIHNYGSGIGDGVIAQTISIDIQGPINPPTTYGCKYWFLVIERATGFAQVFLAKEKTDLYSITKSAINLFIKYGHHSKKIEVDAGKVENSEAYLKLTTELGIEVIAAAPRDQKINTVERYKQTFQANLMAIQLSQNLLGPEYWGPALLSLCDTWNDSFNSFSDSFDGGRKTPNELVKRIKPDILKKQFEFGEMVVWQKSVTPGTNEPNNEFGAAVGRTSTATLVVSPGSLIPRARKQVQSFKANFHNHNYSEIQKAREKMKTNEDGSFTYATPTSLVPFTSELMHTFNQQLPEEEIISDIKNTSPLTENDNNNIPMYSSNIDDLDTLDSNNKIPITTNHSMTRRSQIDQYNSNRESIRPHVYYTHLHVDEKDEVLYIPEPSYKSYVFKARKKHTSDNPTHSQVINDEGLEAYWKPVRDKEFSNFFPPANDILKEVTEDEWKASGQQLLRFLILYTKKYKPNGEFDKDKVRMPVDGAVEGTSGIFKDDDTGTYSPSLASQTFVLMIALAVFLDLAICQTDITACFLMTPIKRPVYATFPPDLTGGIRRFFLLLRCIYGLIDASREWFDLLTPKLRSIGMIQSVFDPCLFIMHRKQSILVVGITTDDLAILRSRTQDGMDMLNELLTMLREKWQITYKDPATGIIGFEIQYNDDKSITLKQGRTIEKITKAFWPDIAIEDRESMIPFNSIPMHPSWNETDQDNSPAIDITSYLEKLGLMIFLLKTRFDSANTISRLSSRTHKCTEKDMESLKYLAAYLYHTRGIGLTFYPNDDVNNTNKLRLLGASDLAFLVYDDSKSQIAFGTKLGSTNSKSAFFNVTSQKEKGSPSSSCPVGEARAAFEETKEIIVYRGILKEITGIDMDATELLEDSSSCIRACSDYMKASISRKMKHERLLFHSLMWYIKNDIIFMTQTKSIDQPMDIGTKPLPNPLHWHHMPNIMGESQELSEAKSRALKEKAVVNFCRTYTNDIQSAKHYVILQQNTEANAQTIEYNQRDTKLSAYKNVTFNTSKNKIYYIQRVCEIE